LPNSFFAILRIIGTLLNTDKERQIKKKKIPIIKSGIEILKNNSPTGILESDKRESLKTPNVHMDMRPNKVKINAHIMNINGNRILFVDIKSLKVNVVS